MHNPSLGVAIVIVLGFILICLWNLKGRDK